MNIEKHRAFLDSLEGEKGLPGSYHGVPLSMPIAEFERVNMVHPLNRVERYLLKRIEILESRQIPDIKERVKELVRDAMNAENRLLTDKWTDHSKEWNEFRALCAEVKP